METVKDLALADEDILINIFTIFWFPSQFTFQFHFNIPFHSFLSRLRGGLSLENINRVGPKSWCTLMHCWRESRSFGADVMLIDLNFQHGSALCKTLYSWLNLMVWINFKVLAQCIQATPLLCETSKFFASSSFVPQMYFLFMISYSCFHSYLFTCHKLSDNQESTKPNSWMFVIKIF